MSRKELLDQRDILFIGIHIHISIYICIHVFNIFLHKIPNLEKSLYVSVTQSTATILILNFLFSENEHSNPLRAVLIKINFPTKASGKDEGKGYLVHPISIK